VFSTQASAYIHAAEENDLNRTTYKDAIEESVGDLVPSKVPDRQGTAVDPKTAITNQANVIMLL